MVKFCLESFNAHEAHALASISQQDCEIGTCTLEYYVITYCSISDVKSMKLHSIGIEIFTIEYCLKQPNYVLVSRHLNDFPLEKGPVSPNGHLK